MKLLVMSDIHGCFSDFNPASMPEADVVLIAGDVTNLGIHRPEEVANAENWLKQLAKKYPLVFYVLGNHDIGLWDGYFERDGTVRCVTRARQFFNDYQFGGADLSPCFNMPKLANNWVRMTANKGVDAEYYATLPPADIVVSHCPPYGYLDEAGKPGSGEHLGSPGLLAYIERHQPRLVVCGHIHEGAGEAMIGDTCVLNVAQQWKIITLREKYMVYTKPDVVE